MLQIKIYVYWYEHQGAVSIRKTVLPGMAIPMLKIRRPNGRLIFNMGIPIPGKDGLYIETGPRLHSVDQSLLTHKQPETQWWLFSIVAADALVWKHAGHQYPQCWLTSY